MSAHTHGFYGLGGSSKSADFGLAANMTLPIVTPVESHADRPGSSATMPVEQRHGRKKARFAVDVDPPEEPQQEVVLRSPSKKPNWRSRFSSLFRRNSKLEKSAGEAEGTGPKQEASMPEELPSKTVDDLEVDVRSRKEKKKRRKKRDKKSRSTAFEQVTGIPYLSSSDMQESSQILQLALKPKGAGNNFEAIRITLRRKSDGFGIHLSGGLPPISVTYVQPGSEAESARIMVGDIVTEVNGNDCREGVEISRIMELKSLIQQLPSEQETTHVDDGSWEKIKEKQEELESDNSEDGEITRIDESTESEAEQQQELAVHHPKAEPPKTEPPLETGSHKAEPPKAEPKSSTPKKPSNKKKTPETIETPPTSPIKDTIISPSDSPSLVTVGVIKKTKRKKKTGSLQEAKKIEVEANKAIVDEPVNESVQKAEQNASLVETSMNISSTPEDLLMPNMDGPKKVKKKKKKKAHREQLSPSSELDRSAPAASIDHESTSIPVGEPSSMNDSPRKSSKDTDGHKKAASGRPKKKRTKAGRSHEESGEKKLSIPSGSNSKLKSKTTVEEADDLEWVDSKKIDSSRRKSVGTVNSDELMPQITSEKRSTSYHDLDKEDRKMFRDELRQASKSEYNIKSKAAGPNVEIDPNVRVKKSGVVIGKRKTNERPSIFETDGAEVESAATGERKKGERSDRKLVLEMDITAIPKTNPSLGLEHGHERLDVVSRSISKRRPASLRKSLLLDSKKEVLMGSERVDLSEPGDGKLLKQQSLPDQASTDMPFRQPDDIEQPQPRLRKQSIAEYMESLQRTKYNSLSRPTQSSAAPSVTQEEPATAVIESSNIRPSASRNIFQQNETSEEHKKPPSSPTKVNKGKQTALPVLQEAKRDSSLEQAKGGGRRSKTVEQPVKKLGIASEPEKSSPVTVRASKQTPEWVAIAQNKHNRTSAMYENKPSIQPSAQTTPPKTNPPLTATVNQQDNSIPKMGTVKDRLAMFQK